MSLVFELVALHVAALISLGAINRVAVLYSLVRRFRRRMIRRMPRMQVYLPDELYQQVKERGLPASELLQEAVRAELKRQELLERTDEYVAELVAEVGAPSAREVARAEAIARRIRNRDAERAS